MKIIVLSWANFNQLLTTQSLTDENICCSSDCFISIRGTDEPPLLQQDQANVLNLEFDDLLHPNQFLTKNGKPLRLFTQVEAQLIINFLKQQRGKENLYIHCFAGISRSGAVGEFAVEYLQEDYELFHTQNPKIIPNTHVLNTLKNQVKSNE